MWFGSFKHLVLIFVLGSYPKKHVCFAQIVLTPEQWMQHLEYVEQCGVWPNKSQCPWITNWLSGKKHRNGISFISVGHSNNQHICSGLLQARGSLCCYFTMSIWHRILNGCICFCSHYHTFYVLFCISPDLFYFAVLKNVQHSIWLRKENPVVILSVGWG